MYVVEVQQCIYLSSILADTARKGCIVHMYSVHAVKRQKWRAYYKLPFGKEAKGKERGVR